MYSLLHMKITIVFRPIPPPLALFSVRPVLWHKPCTIANIVC